MKTFIDLNLYSCPLHACVLSHFSRVWLCATPWTVAPQAPLSMGLSRQEYWSGEPFPSPGDLPDPGIGPGSPALQADSLLSEPQGKPILVLYPLPNKWNHQRLEERRGGKEISTYTEISTCHKIHFSLKVYNSVVFSIDWFTDLCNHHYSLIQKHFITSKQNSIPIDSYFLLPPDPGNHQ